MCRCQCITLRVIIYRGLPVFFMLIAVFDAGLWFSRFDSLSRTPNALTDDFQIYVGFILDCIGSVTGIFPVVLYCFSILVVLPLCCCCTCCTDGNTGVDICKGFCQPATFRLTTFNCNCPFYVTRPKYRFIHRIIFLIAASLIRLAAVIVYATAKPYDIEGRRDQTAFLCGLSILCLICMILLDIYRYRIWWHYRPSCDDRTLWQNLSPKHVRFLPYHLTGNNRSMIVPGNQPCVKQDICTKRELEHIMIFHSSEYKPQLRWKDLTEDDQQRGIYVGFHRTSAEAAVMIAHSDFRISNSGKQMLGYGVYFARSISGTLGKARHGGATICAEIQMGRVKEVTRTSVHTVSNGNQWWTDYDTVYLIHDDDNRDEFCVKDPSQVLRWVIIVDEEFDNNVVKFRLDHEFENTRCGCV